MQSSATVANTLALVELLTPTAMATIPTGTDAPTTGPAPTTTATPMPLPSGCAETRGKMDIGQFATDLQPWPVDMRVYLPPCYDPERAGGYPLLVLLHGRTYNYDQWDRDGMDEKADELITAGEIQPLIIAMPNESHTERDSQKSSFNLVVTDALLRWMEASYNVCKQRVCRAVGGFSRGATRAMHIGFLQPQVFGSIGAHSFTPLIDDVYRLKYWLMNVKLEDLPRFYLDMGDADRPESIEENKRFRAKMTELGVPYEWHWNTGGHDDAYWSAHVEDYLRWYDQAWGGRL
jgi:enterochelin esterase-like enzyme